MGWAHGGVSMEELLRLVRCFVDVLVLAGGRTSSGSAASWRSGDVKKALRWALFFEEVFKNLCDSGSYEESARELDAALDELTSSPNFPKGLADMRSETLSAARELVLQHYLKPEPMSVEHLGAVLEAVVEMDIDGICSGSGRYACWEYAKSILDVKSSSVVPIRNACDIGFSASSDEQPARPSFLGHSRILIQELLKRLDSASYVSLSEKGLKTLLSSITKNSYNLPGSTSCDQIFPKESQILEEFLLWKKWQIKCLSYLLDERTIRIVSGANLIFTAPKDQWIRVFEPLKFSADPCHSSIAEIMEICFLGLVSRRWNPLIESFMLRTFDPFPVPRQYAVLHQLLQGTAQAEHHDKLIVDSKEKDILEYAWQSLSKKPYIFWLLPPVIAAAALPSQSSLFKMYLTEIDKQFDRAASTNRKCNCSGDGVEQHHNCVIAERIRCLYTFHIQQSHLMFL